MLSNIVVAIMCVIAVATGIFAWWVEGGGTSEDPEKNQKKADTERKETVRAKRDKKH